MPFFSILIPSYNRPELIHSAVESVLSNDFEDFELIVSDDKSPRQNEIAAVLDKYASDKRLKVHFQATNLREARNRDFLFREARGTWHIVLCDDDRLSKKALVTLAASIRRYPDAQIYTFGYRLIDEKDRCLYSRVAPKSLRVSLKHPQLARELFVSDAFPFWFYHPATFCSHRTVRERISSNSRIGIGDDLMFLMDFINDGGTLQIVPDILMDYRKFSRNATNEQVNQSLGFTPQLLSRALIVAHLMGRRDLDAKVEEFVKGFEFRKRFLYDAMAISRLSPELVRKVLGEYPKIYKEMCDYVASVGPYMLVCAGWVRRSRFFVRTFGFRGMLELAKVSVQRLTNNAS